MKTTKTHVERTLLEGKVAYGAGDRIVIVYGSEERDLLDLLPGAATEASPGALNPSAWMGVEGSFEFIVRFTPRPKAST